MATLNRAPWVSAGDQMAAQAQLNGNSLVPKLVGKLTNVKSGKEWDMGTEWHGSEITAYAVRKSQWTKGYTVQFFCDPEGGGTQPKRLHVFSLWLDAGITPEEAGGAAVTYMMALNMRRAGDGRDY
jgi:hypothetical protein